MGLECDAMKNIVAFIGLLLAASAASGAEIVLKTPLDYQVVQRSTPGKGLVQIVGDLSEECPPAATIEARFVAGDEEPAWRSVGGSVKDRRLMATAAGPAGGWWRLDVRVMHAGRECGRGSVAHVGVGEVFVVAGQSNSANHGEERQVTESGRVASFDGTAWRLANDPQAGASGTMGSFMPPLGDEKSDDIRSAQASLWKDGIALEGPDSDALTGEMRERGGQGVHLSAKGLREHASRWADKVLPWLEQRWTAPRTADGGTEWSDYAQLPECHSIGWVRANVQSQDTKRWDGVLDEAIWGTPSPQQAVGRNWDWKISDDAWREAVKQHGEGPMDEVAFDLWVPDGVAVVKGIVAISGHGSGENLFRHPGMRALAKELHLALFKFVGNPMQRGFWPTSLLFQRLRTCGDQCGHPELEHAPLFLYGHSNGTGFSAIFAANEPARVWGWISMRPGITFQVGRNWDSFAGGYQSLSVFPFADFPGEKAAASWLLNAAYADDWQTFQRDGEVASPR